MTISKAFIQEYGNGKLRHEERLVVAELNRRGIPIELYTEQRIRRRQLPLDLESRIRSIQSLWGFAARRVVVFGSSLPFGNASGTPTPTGSEIRRGNPLLALLAYFS